MFPTVLFFGLGEMFMDLPGVQSALFHMYMSDMESSRYFLNVIVVYCQCSLKGMA